MIIHEMSMSFYGWSIEFIHTKCQNHSIIRKCGLVNPSPAVSWYLSFKSSFWSSRDDVGIMMGVFFIPLISNEISTLPWFGDAGGVGVWVWIPSLAISTVFRWGNDINMNVLQVGKLCSCYPSSQSICPSIITYTLYTTTCCRAISFKYLLLLTNPVFFSAFIHLNIRQLHPAVNHAIHIRYHHLSRRCCDGFAYFPYVLISLFLPSCNLFSSVIHLSFLPYISRKFSFSCTNKTQRFNSVNQHQQSMHPLLQCLMHKETSLVLSLLVSTKVRILNGTFVLFYLFLFPSFPVPWLRSSNYLAAANAGL